jgi:hypothetical protein
MLGLSCIHTAWKNASKQTLTHSKRLKTQKTPNIAIVPNRSLSMAPIRRIYRKSLQKIGIKPSEPKIPSIAEFDASTG